MKAHIDIDTKTFVRFWLVVIGFAVAAYLIYSARTALFIIGLSAFLALILSRPVSRLMKILPGKSIVLSTAIAYVLVVALLGFVVFLVIPPIAQQSVKFAQNAPTFIDNAAKQSTWLTDFVRNNHLQPVVDQIITSAHNSLSRFTSGAAAYVIEGISSILTTITALILVLVLTFLMIIEGPTWIDRLWRVYHDKRKMEHHKNVMSLMYNVVSSYVTGQLTVSSIAGFVAGVAVFILSIYLNIPMSLAIPSAALIFVCSLVPLFGELVGNILVSLILLLNSVTAAIIFFIVFILYQQLEANYISPNIQAKRVALSPLAILVAVTIGIYMFGIVGAIVSIPVAGCIKVIVDDYLQRDRTAQSKEKPDELVA